MRGTPLSFAVAHGSVRSGDSNRLDRGIAEKTKLRESLYIERIEVRSGLGEFLARFQRRASDGGSSQNTSQKILAKQVRRTFPVDGP